MFPEIGMVYGLYDPRTGLLRYIGFTTRELNGRLREHIVASYFSDDTRCHQWIRELIGCGLKPAIRLLQANATKQNETNWIAWFHGSGFQLTNEIVYNVQR